MLFLGNSYTFFNDLDLVVGTIFADAGTTVATARLAEGGYTFVDHLGQLQTPGSAWEAAFAQPQDWVLLQEQSQIPGFPETESYVVDSRAAARELDAAAAGAGAQTLFFMTWGRRDGDSDNPELYPDFPTMNALLVEGYRRYVADAAEDGSPAWVAPVGLAWEAVWAAEADPTDPESSFYRLYQEDGSHPSARGSWLAACVIYSAITGQSAEGLPAPPEVEDGEALAATAWAVVEADLDDDFPWRTDPDDSGDSGGDDSGGGDSGGGDSDGGDPDSAAADSADPSLACPEDSRCAEACGCAQAPGGAGLGIGVGLLLLGRRRVAAAAAKARPPRA